jgi:hypothetical protein
MNFSLDPELELNSKNKLFLEKVPVSVEETLKIIGTGTEEE